MGKKAKRPAKALAKVAVRLSPGVLTPGGSRSPNKGYQEDVKRRTPQVPTTVAITLVAEREGASYAAVMRSAGPRLRSKSWELQESE